MSQGVLGNKKTDFIVKKDFLSHVTTGPISWGYVTFGEGGKMVVGQFKDNTVDDVYELMEVAKDMSVVFQIYNDPVDDDNALQPFVALRDDKDIPSLALLIEGDFTDKYGMAAKGFYNDYLGPKLGKIAKLADGDIDIIREEVTDDGFKADVLAQMGERAVVFFVFGDKDHSVYSIAKANNLGAEFDWGEVTNTMGYTEKVEQHPPGGTAVEKTEEPVMDELTKRMLERKAKKAAEANGVHTTEAKPTAVNKPSEQSKLMDDVKDQDAAVQRLTLSTDYTIKDGKVFPGALICAHRQNIKEWLNRNFGTCPDDYKLWVGAPEKCLGLPVAGLKNGSSLKTAMSDKIETARANKNTAAEHVKPAAEPKKEAAFPIIGREAKENIGKYIKTIDTKSNDIIKPETLQAIENGGALYWGQFPDTCFEHFMHWKPEAVEKHCIDWPRATSLLVQTLRYQLAETLARLPKAAPAAKTADEELAERMAARAKKKAAM